MNRTIIAKAATGLALAAALLVAAATPPTAAAKQDKKHPVCGVSPRVIDVGQTTGGTLPAYQSGETKYVSIEDLTWSPQDGLEGTHTQTKYQLTATPEGAGRLFTVTVAYKVQPMKKETKPIFSGKDKNGKPIKIGEQVVWTENGKEANDSCQLKILVRITPLVAVLTTGEAVSGVTLKLPGDASPKAKDDELKARVAEVDLVPKDRAIQVYDPHELGEGSLTFSYGIGNQTLKGGKLTVHVVGADAKASLSVAVPVGGTEKVGSLEIATAWLGPSPAATKVVDGTAAVDQPKVATVQTKEGELVIKGQSVGTAKATALLAKDGVKGKLEVTIHVVDRGADVSIPVTLVLGGPPKTVDAKDIKSNWANDGTIAEDQATFAHLVSVWPWGIADVQLKDGKVLLTPRKVGKATAIATFDALLNSGKPPVGKRIVGVATIDITVVDAPRDNGTPSDPPPRRP